MGLSIFLADNSFLNSWWLLEMPRTLQLIRVMCSDIPRRLSLFLFRTKLCTSIRPPIPWILQMRGFLRVEFTILLFNPQNGKPGLLIVWPLSFDITCISGSTGSVRSCRYCSQSFWESQISSPRKVVSPRGR